MKNKCLVLISVIAAGLIVSFGIGVACGKEHASEERVLNVRTIADHAITVSDNAIAIPILSLSGFSVFAPEERIADPAAQSAEYVFLVRNQEAVNLEGPVVKGADYFAVENVKVSKVGYGYFEDPWAKGFEIIVNPHVTYTISLIDLEDEVDLAEVRLSLAGESIASAFVLAGCGDGVINNITITALIDGMAVGSNTARAVEVRGSRQPGIQTSLRRISSGQETSLDMRSGLHQVSFTDFAFVVDFNSPVNSGHEDTLSVYGCGTNTRVRVFSQRGTIAEAEAHFFFPEDNPANQASTKVEIIGEDTILVSPAAGDFPSQSQIVLELDFGGGSGYVARVFT